MGIFEPPERQRLFKLIQQVKRQQQAQAQPASQPANAPQQQQPPPAQQPLPTPPQPQPPSQQTVPAVSQLPPQPQPQFVAPPQPPKPTAVPRQSVAPLQSAPPTSRRIDQLSQPRDRAIVERAASISVSPAVAASFIASASPPPSHSPALSSPRASYSAKRRTGVSAFELPPVNNQPSQAQPPPQPQPHCSTCSTRSMHVSVGCWTTRTPVWTATRTTTTTTPSTRPWRPSTSPPPPPTASTAHRPVQLKNPCRRP